MDPPPKHFQSPKSHVLDTNGVLYSSFWLAGPKKTPKLDKFVSKIVPRDLEERRSWDLEGRHHGTLRGGAGTLRGGARDSRGSTLLLFSSIFLPLPYINNLDNSKLKNLKYYPNYWCREEARKLKRTIKQCCSSKPLCGPSRSQVRRPSRSLGINLATKILKFWWFWGLSNQTKLYHTPLLSEMWDLDDRTFFGGRSL